MFDYTVFQWILFFYFYSFFGWCFESAVVSISRKRLINRGFLQGPFLPLYGSGAIMMLVVSKPFEHCITLVYLSGCVGSTALEYVTGVAMESLFGVRYWDYSHKKYNYKGHICLSSTLVWGGLTVLVTKYIHPVVERIVLSLPKKAEQGITLFLSAGFSNDYIQSFKDALDFKELLYKLEKVNKEISHLQKRLEKLASSVGDELGEKKELLMDLKNELTVDAGENLHELTERLQHMKDNKEGLLQLRDMGKKRLLKNNPLTSKRFKKTLDEIREYLNF